MWPCWVDCFFICIIRKKIFLGEVDEDIEVNLDLNAIKADALKPFVN